MRDWKFFILEHKRTVETCRLSMEASVLLLSFLFHSGMIIPLSSGCFAGKSTKFLNLFCWYSFSLFHSLNTSSKYNFILSCKGWPAMSSHREFYQDYCRLEFLTKYPFAPRLAKSDAMIKFLIVVGSIFKELWIICFPLWRETCLWFSQLASVYVQNLTEIPVEAKSFLSENWADLSIS